MFCLRGYLISRAKWRTRTNETPTCLINTMKKNVFLWMQNFELHLGMFIRHTRDIENASEHAKFPVNGKFMPIKLSTLCWWPRALENPVGKLLANLLTLCSFFYRQHSQACIFVGSAFTHHFSRNTSLCSRSFQTRNSKSWKECSVTRNYSN